jgi:hypothetical protein
MALGEDTMAESSGEKRQRPGKAMLQHEADAQLLREKTARLRELRLAREAANAVATSKSPDVKKKPGKQREKAQSLSDWLAAQQNQGRRG